MSALIPAKMERSERIPDNEANWMLIHAGAAPFNDDLSIEEKEQRLREGARALVQFWDDVQAEKAKRAKAIAQPKQKVLIDAKKSRSSRGGWGQ
ncbi:hypothetical protein [Acetobacter estunensis]|uniref:hypothetical protein n=1 Tax=Acetobacter estunensis TaxID=104097 RepID=UPI001C2CCE9C|nr:hypothetical protein [Acetobacter estunensis]MBV1837168.1 hypothetical protein [Acetobacter estunensis]